MATLPQSRPVPSRPAVHAEERPVDRFGKVETKGIDYIDEAARHGRPRELFSVWLASNVAYIYLIVGGLLMVLGLSVWQAFAVLFAGNLFWALVGFLSVSGPQAGTPSEIVTRAMFGVRGNRLLGAGLSWVVCVAYEGLNLAIGSLAGFALMEYWGAGASGFLKVVVAVLIGLVTFTISVYGHATIVRFSVPLTALLAVCVLVLGGFVLAHAHAAPAHFTALHGSALWSTIFIGFTVVASLPLSWGNGADYARYLPSTTSKRAVAGWTALGGWLPAMVLGGIGILAGTAVDMEDPQTSMRALVPGAFYAVFLLVLVLGSITNNVLTAYSSGLALQAVGVRLARAKTVLIDAALGGALCAYALLSTHFLTTMNNVLALTVTFLGPTLAIYGIDIVLRRNNYDGLELHQDGPSAAHWYTAGVNPAGAAALIIGTFAAVMCVNTVQYAGPVATALKGADISSLVGPLVALIVYVAVTKMRRTASA